MSPGCPPAQVRLDLLFTLLRPERSLIVAPHGLVGQTFDGSDVGWTERLTRSRSSASA